MAIQLVQLALPAAFIARRVPSIRSDNSPALTAQFDEFTKTGLEDFSMPMPFWLALTRWYMLFRSAPLQKVRSKSSVLRPRRAGVISLLTIKLHEITDSATSSAMINCTGRLACMISEIIDREFPLSTVSGSLLNGRA